MGQTFEFLRPTLERLDLWAVIDIAVVALLIYLVVGFFRGTTASSVLVGLILLLLAFALVQSVPGLVVLNWLLKNSLPWLPIALIILFQPELRRAMEHLGRVRALPQSLRASPGNLAHTIDELARAAARLAELRYGALIVLERETGLQDYNNGVQIDGLVSSDFLVSIFYPNAPLHDGAAIVRGDRVIAASCLLPLTNNPQDQALGTRHRAGIGITEETDAIAIIVSEETGQISLANNGVLRRDFDQDRLRRVLTLLYHPTPAAPRWRLPRTLLQPLAGAQRPTPARGEPARPHPTAGTRRPTLPPPEGARRAGTGSEVRGYGDGRDGRPAGRPGRPATVEARAGRAATRPHPQAGTREAPSEDPSPADD